MQAFLEDILRSVRHYYDLGLSVRESRTRRGRLDFVAEFGRLHSIKDRDRLCWLNYHIGHIIELTFV